MFRAIKNLFSDNRKNGLMLLVVSLTMLLLGGIVNISSVVKNNRNQREVEEILSAFEKAVRSLYDDGTYPFTYAEMVWKEHIQNYAACCDSSYLMLYEQRVVYRTFLEFVGKERAEQMWRIRQCRKKVAEMKKQEPYDSNKLALQEKLLWLMEKFGPDGDANGESFGSLIAEAEELDKKINQMKNNSPGWRYVIEAKTEQGTVCRFIYMSSEDEPLKLKLVGGGVVEE